MRLDFYVGERDLLGIGFSDNVVFRKQYYARAVFDDLQKLKLRKLLLHTGEDFKKEEKTRASQDHGPGRQRSMGVRHRRHWVRSHDWLDLKSSTGARIVSSEPKTFEG